MIRRLLRRLDPFAVGLFLLGGSFALVGLITDDGATIACGIILIGTLIVGGMLLTIERAHPKKIKKK